ncbi:MAG: sulfatase [Rubrobacteraceae bacterium]|nr:sulfatase [Rubrobacteraceae bacterium]
MSRTVLLSVAVALAVLLLSGVWGSASREARGATTKPNIVFILADDMRKDDLKYMPKTRSVLKDRGMSFRNAYVSNPLCCPSRATTLRGQYAHNTGVWNIRGPSGGWQTYRTNGLERDNVATRLDAAGYRTALIGKYLNGYAGTTNKPPGWDRWFAHTDGAHYYDYKINDDGAVRRFGSSTPDYETDVIANRAKTFIRASAKKGLPFFAYVAPKAPHKPYIPAPRDRHTFDGLKALRPPSFNEQDVSDKPPWIRGLPRLSDAKKAKIDNRAEKRAETLQALDDLVAGVVGELKDKGVLSNTYIFFTSDNGFHIGEHRILGGKGRPYEESVHVPLLVRGPGVGAGSSPHKLALNTDYLPTFTDLGDAQTPGYADGRSLQPVLEGKATAWRTAVLLEADRTTGGSTPPYSGIHTGSEHKYVKYADGKKERYYLGRDPYELRNSYNPKSPPATLAKRLRALKTCAAASCRAAENGR